MCNKEFFTKIFITLFLIGLGNSLLGQSFKNAVSLDGIDDYMVVPHTESLNPGNGSWSVVFWIKATNKDQIAPVVMKRFPGDPYTQYSYGFGKDDPHNPEPGKSFRVNHIQSAGGSERSGHINEEVIDGEWHHIAVVANKANDRIEIYIDGLLKEFVALYYYGAWPSVETTTDLIIAKGSSDDKVEGLLDEMSIWNKALDHSQIIRCMYDTLSPNFYSSADSNLVAYYRFDDLENFGVSGNSNDDFQDLSVFGNHADAEGSPELVESVITPDTIYVDQSNNSGDENGTEEYPFNTLAEGMNAASSGKTLFIKNGNYNPVGGILNLKAGVKLEGESKENVIIDGDLKDTTNSDLAVKIEKLTFNEFYFGRPPLINGVVTEASYIRHCSCERINIAHGGGYTDETQTDPGPIPYFHITDNETGFYGIGFSFMTGSIVGENIITGNTGSSVGLSHGWIEMTDFEPLPEYGYLIENNALTGGISFSQGGCENVEVIVKNNTAKGISISSGSGYTYTITGNTFEDGYSDSSGANKTIFSNNIITNGIISDSSNGLRDGTEDAIIENNIINYNNEDEHLSLISVSSASISLINNTITGTGKLSGISMSSGVPSNVINNNITLDEDNQPAGGIWKSSYTYVINTSAGEGIISGNKLHGAFYGYYSSSGATEFSNNEVTSAHHGFLSSGNEEVKGNTIKNCSGHGVILGGVRGSVHDNIIMDNDSAGIYILKNRGFNETKPIEIYRNIIKNNGWYDLVIEYESDGSDTVFAQNNLWDHESLQEILQYDILNLYPGNITVIADPFIVTPDTPILLNPENADLKTDTALNLSWQSTAGAEYYKIQVACDAGFNNLIYNVDSISATSYAIDKLDFNMTYYWRCLAFSLAGESAWSETWWFQTRFPTGLDKLPKPPVIDFKIYPNPVKEETTILYSIEKAGLVTLGIYDFVGREVESLVNKHQTVGRYRINYNVADLESGMYYIRLITSDYSIAKKAELIK